MSSLDLVMLLSSQVETSVASAISYWDLALSHLFVMSKPTFTTAMSNPDITPILPCQAENKLQSKYPSWFSGKVFHREGIKINERTQEGTTCAVLLKYDPSSLCSFTNMHLQKKTMDDESKHLTCISFVQTIIYGAVLFFFTFLKHLIVSIRWT